MGQTSLLSGLSHSPNQEPVDETRVRPSPEGGDSSVILCTLCAVTPPPPPPPPSQISGSAPGIWGEYGAHDDGSWNVRTMTNDHEACGLSFDRAADKDSD